MGGEVGHFSIPADDIERAQKFYSSSFGWKVNVMPGGDHSMVSTGPVDDKGMPRTPGFVGGSIGKRGGPLLHPVVWIMVDDMAAVEATIEKNGGTIVQRKQAIGDGAMGYSGYFKDSEGNIVALYQHGPV